MANVHPVSSQPQMHQPQMQQPQMHHHSTTVVVQQQQPLMRQKRDWSTGLCGCFEDILNCLAVTFCCTFYQCYLPTKTNENPCLCLCLPSPAWLTALRTKVRAENGIQGSICGDCCCVTCCGPCVMCQLSREIDNINSGRA